MQNTLQQLATLIGQVLNWFGNLLRLVYDWSIGQVWRMTELPFGSLPIWKQVLYVVVIVAIVYLVYRIATDLWEALQKVFGAIVGLIVAIFNQLKPVLIAGAIAFGGAWVILNVDLPWLQ